MYTLIKDGKFLLAHGFMTGSIVEADLIKWYEAYVAASQEAMKLDAKVISAKEVIEMLVFRMDDKTKEEINRLKEENKELKDKLNCLSRVNVDLLHNANKLH